MMKIRKGMTMALGVIIAIVVLIVVALAVIAITTGSVNIFGSDTSTSIDSSGDRIVGTASCTDCGWRETKGDTSKLNDIVHRNAYYCQDAAGIDYCCESAARDDCIARTDCGQAFADTTAAESVCTPA